MILKLVLKGDEEGEWGLSPIFDNKMTYMIVFAFDKMTKWCTFSDCKMTIVLL